jgi:hypothetical protein
MLIVEIFLSGAWNPFYFRNGLPLFQRRVQMAQVFMHLPIPEEIEQALKRGYMPSLVFRRLDSHTYAFREKLFELNLVGYTPIMHGLLSFNPRAEVVVTGFANWSVLALCFTAVFFFMEWPDILFLWFPVAIIAAIYVLQSKRYAAVGDTAAKQCTS